MDPFLLVILVTSTGVVLGGHPIQDKHECCPVVLFWHVQDEPACRPDRCPQPQGKEWPHLQNLCCPQDRGYFHCQQDDQGNINVICATPVLCPAGTFASVGKEGTMAFKSTFCLTCPLDEYQPTANYSFTFLRPSCGKKRIKCEDFGAVPLSTGNSSSDDTCTCNWMSGYRPVSTSRYHCRTFNSSHAATCSCVRHPCPKSQVLHPKSMECVSVRDLDEDYFHERRAFLEQLKDGFDGRYDIMLALTAENFQQHKKLAEVKLAELVLDVLPHLSDFKMHQSYILVPVKEEKEEGFSLHWRDIWGPLFIATVIILALKELLGRVFTRKVIILAFRKWLGKCFTRKDGHRKDWLVRVWFKSQRTADTVHREVKNILPMLALHYGRLSLVYGRAARHLSIIVHPKAKRPLHLAHFIRDILSPEAVRRAVAHGQGSRADDIQICAWRGHLEDASQAHIGHTPPTNCSNVSCDTGEIVFRFNDEADEQLLLRSLRDPSSQDSLSDVFAKHQLELQTIRSGSIILRFHLPNGSRTFDTFAEDQRIKDFAKDLLSHQAFKSLAKDMSVKVEFFCKARLENVSVVRAEHLTMLIGMNNNVYLCDNDSSTPCDHAQASSTDDDLHVTTADDRQAAIGEMLKVNTLSVTMKTDAAAAARLGVENKWVTENRNQNDVFIQVRCPTPRMLQSLGTQWQSIMPLLRNHYADCHMHCKGKRIIWRLRVAGGGTLPDASSFLRDIFAIEGVKYLVMENSPRVDVVLPNCAKAGLSPRERWRVFLKRSRKWKPLMMNVIYFISVVLGCAMFGGQLMGAACLVRMLYARIYAQNCDNTWRALYVNLEMMFVIFIFVYVFYIKALSLLSSQHCESR